MLVVKHVLPERGELALPSAGKPPSRHNERCVLRLQLLCEHGELLVYGRIVSSARSTCQLIRRVAHYGVEFQSLTFYLPYFGIAELVCEAHLIVHPVEQPGKVYCVYRPLVLIAHECAAGYAARHLCTAKDKDILRHNLSPDALRFLQRHLILGLRQLHEIYATSEIQRIKAGLGVHLQQMRVRVAENIGCDIAVFYETRLVQRTPGIEVLVEEAVAANRVAHVHIYDAPRSQHSLLIGVAEMGNNLRYPHGPAERRQLVCGSGHAPDAETSAGDDVAVVVFQQLKEQILGNSLGHKFVPRLGVYLLDEFLHGNVLVDILTHTVNQQGKPYGDSAKQPEHLLAFLLELLLFFDSSFLFGGTLALRLVLGLLGNLVLLVSQSLAVYGDLLRQRLGLGLPVDYSGKLVEQLYILAVHDDADALVVDGVVVKAGVDGLVHAYLLYLPHKALGFIRQHLCAFDRDNGAEIEELAQRLALLLV